LCLSSLGNAVGNGSVGQHACDEYFFAGKEAHKVF
jgi:hypothetical protein